MEAPWRKTAHFHWYDGELLASNGDGTDGRDGVVEIAGFMIVVDVEDAASETVARQSTRKMLNENMMMRRRE